MDNPQQPSLLGFDEEYLNKSVFTGMAKWARRLSIIGIVGIAVLVIVFFGFGRALISYFENIISATGRFDLEGMAGAGLGAVGMGLIAVILFIVVAIFGVLLYFLFRGSSRIRQGVALDDQAMFNSGLLLLRNYFVMWSVLTGLGLLSTLSAYF